jgi:hypothetical protein
MPAVYNRFGVYSDTSTVPTTLYHSLNQYTMYIWRALPRISAQ